MTGTLQGRRALVTGGTSGIGLAIVRALRREGAQVVTCSQLPDKVAETRELFADDPEVRVEVADVRRRDDLARLRETLDGLDILVPNAGTNVRTRALDLGDDDLRLMLETNLYGAYVTCQEFAPLLLRRPGGRVVVTSSISSVHGFNVRAAYTATKAGLSGLVRSLAVEWGPEGTTVNAVGPGIIRTPLTQAYMTRYPERERAVVANTPLRRVGEPEDVADVVAFLASDAARFITGQTIMIDGGISAGSEWW